MLLWSHHVSLIIRHSPPPLFLPERCLFLWVRCVMKPAGCTDSDSVSRVSHVSVKQRGQVFWEIKRDAGLQCRVPLSSVCVILLILIFYFYWPVWDIFFFATLHRRSASRSRLFTVEVETGVLLVLFNEAASWGLVRHLLLKLDPLMYLSSCSVVHRGLPLLFLFWLEPVCAVLWRE